MTEPFVIATVPLKNGGRIGLCRLPGSSDNLGRDVMTIKTWQAALVVSLTESAELQNLGAQDLSKQLAANHIGWRHFPIIDYGVPTNAVVADWPKLSREIKQALSRGQNVLLHCRGGIGRSGMIALRLMIELGEAPDAALARLREARPGAVETDAQMAWAKSSVV